MELSIADLKRNYSNLNVFFDLWKGESDVDKYIASMLANFESKGYASYSNGALVIEQLMLEQKEKDFTLADLEEAYPKASKKAKEQSR